MNKRLLNKNGFTSLHFLVVLPILLMITFAFSFNAYFIQLKTSVRSQCLIESIQIQKEMIHAEKKLFKLNSISDELKLELIAAYIALAAATETGVGVALIELQIERIKSEQQALDQMQKMIISAANINAQLRSVQLVSQLIHIVQNMNSIWSFYLKNFFTIKMSQYPRLAVHPKTKDIAPNYELEGQYKTSQALAFEWQHQFTTQTDAQQFLDSHIEFAMNCGSSPNRQGEEWIVEIKEDKF